MITVDARNLDCPEPVIRTKKALENLGDDKLIVLVNNSTSLENVKRFAQNQGCSVAVSEKDGTFTLDINPVKKVEEKAAASQPVMLIGSDQLGSGDEALGLLLMASFINTLPEAKSRPAKILFMNRGVFLTTEGSRVLSALQQLEAEGVAIFSCGTCLNHYQIKDKLKVGRVTNMYDSVDSLLSAEKVIRI